MMHISSPPFVSAETLILLYPELEPVLDTIPCRIQEKVRMYDAFIALDVVNALRKKPPATYKDEPFEDS